METLQVATLLIFALSLCMSIIYFGKVHKLKHTENFFITANVVVTETRLCAWICLTIVCAMILMIPDIITVGNLIFFDL